MINAIEVTPEEEEAWKEREAFGLLVVNESKVANNFWEQKFDGKLIAIGSPPGDPHADFIWTPPWEDEEFLDDLPPFRD